MQNFFQDTMQLTNFVWSIALFVGCWGLGNPLAKKIKAPGWAAAPIGMAIIILVAGWLDVTSNATRTTMTLLALGSIGFGLLQIRDIITSVKNIGKCWAWIAILTGIISAWNGCEYNPLIINWDDSTGYIPVCHELSAHGQSWAPLSLRRALSWGGQFPLQNLGMLFTSEYGAYVYETSLTSWMWTGVAVSLAKIVGGWRGPIFGLLIPLLPHTGVNSAPHASLAIIILAAWTLRQHAWIFGALAASAMALRLQAVPMIGLIAIWAIYENYRNNPEIKPITNWCWKSGVILLTTIAPFILNHISQFQTPLPMLHAGTIDPDHLSWVRTEHTTATNFWQVCTLLSMTIITLSWGMVSPKSRGIAMSALITLFYFTYAMPEYSIGEWLRYSWPIILVAMLVIINSAPNTVWITIFAMACITLPTISFMKERSKKTAIPKISVEKLMQKKEEQATKAGPTINQLDFLKLADVQNLVPENATLAIISAQTSYANFERNKIFNLDEFTAIGNTPTEKTMGAWQKWGSKHGIDFLIFNDFAATSGGQTLEKIWLTPSTSAVNLKHYQRVWYPKRKKVIDALNGWKTTYPHQSLHGFILMDLRSEK